MRLFSRRQILLSGVAAASAGSAVAALSMGEEAPDFTLPGTDGKNTTLSSFRGKNNVVLAFFPKAFTGG